ncbi:MAG: hypothetical protein ACLQUT_08035 [Thermoleophilia bacterium]
MTGKTIRNFLADREPTGILLAAISNWTGKVLVAPRSQLDQLSKREEVRRTGVYLLAGPDPDDPSRGLASIGEGDHVLKRLLRHNKNEAKDFWERTVVIVNENVAFNSPSAAGSVVLARASNGRVSCQVETTGQTYAEWQDAKLLILGADVAGADNEDDDGPCPVK